MANYYPPPPGVGGAPSSLPPRPPSHSQSHAQLDFRPPPSGPSAGNGNNGGGRDRSRGGRHRNRNLRNNSNNGGGGGGGGGGGNNDRQHNNLPPRPSQPSSRGGDNNSQRGPLPPQGDFTFRAEKPAGVQEAQQRGDHYAPGGGQSRRDRDRDRDRDRGRDFDRRGGPPPSGPRSQQQHGGGGGGRSGNDRRGGRDGQNNSNGYQPGRYGGGRGRGGGGGPGGRFGSRFIAANRPILDEAQHANANGGVVQDFVAGGNEGTTYLNLDDLSDSDQAEMDISGDELDGTGDAPPRKRARRLGAARAADEVPKWSNPDPYTVLPPTAEEGGAKEKDVVQLIRKARVQGERASAATSGDTEEFISFGMDSDEEEEVEEGEAGEAGEAGQGGDARANGNGGRDQRGRNGRTDASANRDAQAANSSNKNNASAPKPPADAPKGPRAQNQSQSQSQNQNSTSSPASKNDKNGRAATTASSSSLSLSAELGTSRKRTHDDELKPLLLPDHAILKKATKMPVGGVILPGWQVKAREPPCPWLPSSQGRGGDSAETTTTHMGVWLHKEVVDFYDFIRPRSFEQALRQALLDDLASQVRKRFSNGRIHCFGSFMSGLYLPTGDMDIVMCSTQFLANRPPVFSKKGHLFKFGSFLCSNQMADREHLEHITKAKVPLVKYIDLKTGLKVDVSFENMNGVVANNTFTRWKEQFPEMPILVTLIKQFLTMRGLNEPVNGGIGGFSVICLVVSMLQLMPPLQTKDMVGAHHLGDLLMHFFDLYGNKFNYETTAISMDPPGYVPKSKVRNFTYKNPDRLSIIDPNNPENDIAGGSKNTPAIMRVFADAFDALQTRMMELARLPAGARANQSILGVVLEGDYSTYRNQREYLRELYVRLHKAEPED